MPTFQWFASLFLAATILPALAAETHCPGNVASVPLHFVDRHRIVVAVSINHTGPYDFLLDTGTQITMIDPSLAAALHLDTQGAAVVAGVGPGRSASYAQLDLSKPALTLLRTRKSWFITSRISTPPIPTCGAFSGRISSNNSTC